MSAPACTVVVPTRDRPGSLPGCLEALAALTVPPGGFEVLVVDDGGSWALESALPRGDLDIAVVRRERSGGPAAARNAGLERARGEFVAFTDDDCRPEPGWLVALHEAWGGRPDVGVGGDVVNALPDNRYSAASQLVHDAAHAYFNAGEPRFFANANLAFPTRTLAELGGFDVRLRTAEDREVCERWLSSGRRLVRAPAAPVRHAHHLTARGFVRQHVSYGRGVGQLRARGAAAGSGRRRPSIDVRYDVSVVALAFRRARGAQAAALAALGLLAHGCYAAGYLAEARRGAVARNQGVR